MDTDAPGQHIERERERLSSVATEAQLLETVLQIPALADSSDERWANDSFWSDAYKLIGAADVVGDRGWKAVVGPIFERAALGDLHGMMQSIRHGPERAFHDDHEGFADILENLAGHTRPGTRQWSVRELGILRLKRSIPVLAAAANDPVEEVQDEARLSLEMVAQQHAEAAQALEQLD